ncbi:NAD(P)-dependent oxidoreductase [Propionicicella superfundia]|uniref:NAD(P)-dependent oxidoreductase n=1 Tax=Propionicicella superfundia TaxID=348582 RepID=UPI0003F815E0|nr:NAD(P)-dependent oxidoreductase [Propionicicella superfundia]
MTAPTVAVLGLGAMGLPMAARLHEGLPVRAYDISADRRALAAQEGIPVAESPQDAARGAAVVLLVVRDGAQLQDVLFGADGIVGVLDPAAVVILTSTVGTEGVTPVAAALADKQIALVDAPLSGGPVRARKGDLLIVVGGEPAARDKAAPALERLASTLTVVGDKPGDGQAFKTVNQLLCGVHIAAAAEALALADAMGLDPAKTLDALCAGAANSFMLADRGTRMLEAYDEEGPQVLSRLDIFVKDMGIVTAAARHAHLAAPVAAAAQQLYLLGEERGQGADDDSTVIRVLASRPRTPRS